MRILLVLFIAMPIIEMWLLISVGGEIGALPTIGLVLLTAMIGLALLKHQGRAALQRAQQKMQVNELPAREIADSLFFAVGGALLLTPGFVTDAVGFACLTPGVRTVIIQFFAKHLILRGNGQFQGGFSSHASPFSSDDIIDGEIIPDKETHNRVNHDKHEKNK